MSHYPHACPVFGARQSDERPGRQPIYPRMAASGRNIAASACYSGCVGALVQVHGGYSDNGNDESAHHIHDFGGFPQALFDVRYPAAGSSELAQQVIELLAPVACMPISNGAMDHGAYWRKCICTPIFRRCN